MNLSAVDLFTPFQLGPLRLPNRIVMAPMTRNRAAAGDVPGDLIREYYCQRASAGLIITEGSQIAPEGQGYPFTPGIHSPEQIAGWRRVTDAVHANGGRIYLQLWHVGRVSHPSLLPGNAVPVAPSAIKPAGQVYTFEGFRDFVMPRALETAEMPTLIEQFRSGARNARAAGFDGVEIHGANGYLLHEFSSDVVNQRIDDYGGSPDNRARLSAEVVEAVAAEIGAGRVGLRISPGNTAGDMRENDTVCTYQALLDRIAPLGAAYLHLLIHPEDAAFGELRGAWPGPVVLNTGRDTDTRFCQLEELADWGVISAAAVGRAFLANPDLIDRLIVGAELNEPDVGTFYAPGPAGYVDYPTLAELEGRQSA